MKEEELNKMSNDELIGIIKAQRFEIDRLNNIINELEEYILNHYIVGHTIQNASLDGILDKLKELKENK